MGTEQAESPRGAALHLPLPDYGPFRRARNQALGLPHADVFGVAPSGAPYAASQRRMEQSNWNRVTEISSPKLEYIASEVMKKRRCGHIIFGEPVGFHYWMRELLVQKGFRASASPSSTQRRPPPRCAGK